MVSLAQSELVSLRVVGAIAEEERERESREKGGLIGETSGGP